jgi:hypothetical protein
MQKTYTSNFLYPLLDIPKSYIGHRFVNAYVADDKVDNYPKGYIYVVASGVQDRAFSNFVTTMSSLPNFIDSYELCESYYIGFIYDFPDDSLVDAGYIFDGKYSKVSFGGQRLIKGNSIDSKLSKIVAGTNLSGYDAVFKKHKVLASQWEKKLDYPISANDMEVWPHCDFYKNEIINDKVREELDLMAQRSRIATQAPKQ